MNAVKVTCSCIIGDRDCPYCSGSGVVVVTPMEGWTALESVE